MSEMDNIKIIHKHSDHFFELGNLVIGYSNNRPTIYNDSKEPYWYRDIMNLERTLLKKDREKIKPVLQIALDNKEYLRKVLFYVEETNKLYIYGNKELYIDEGELYEDTEDFTLFRGWYKCDYKIVVSPKLMLGIIPILVKNGIIPTKKDAELDKVFANAIMEALVTSNKI